MDAKQTTFDIERAITAVKQAIRKGEGGSLEDMQAASEALEAIKANVESDQSFKTYFEQVEREEKRERQQYGDEYYERVIEPRKYPWRFEDRPMDTTGIESKYEQLAAEMIELSKRSGTTDQMNSVRGEMEKLEKQEAAAQAKNHQIYLKDFAAELSTLDTDINNLTNEITLLSKNPSSIPGATERIDKLGKQLDQRIARKDAIEKGEAFNLGWSDPNAGK